jgi:hypothetical protein
VVQTPLHKSLTAINESVCPASTVPMNLTNIGSRESYELFGVTINGGTETSTLIGVPGINPNWSVGYGTYYVRSTAPNCPTDVSNRLTINPITHKVTLQTNKGTIAAQGVDYRLTACEGDLITLSVSEGSGYKWYKHNGICDTQNTAAIPPSQLFSYCNQKIMNANGTSTDGSSTQNFMIGYLPKILLTGVENVCQQPFNIYIEMNAVPNLQVSSITPEMVAREQGPGSDAFSTQFSGLKYDQTWEMLPPAAGSISSNGVVAWNPSWNSFLSEVKEPAKFKVNVKSCSGWTSYPFEIDVYPLLDSKENRIRSYAPKQALQDYPSVLLQIENPVVVNVSSAFFDGLGRNVQNVQYFGASFSKDLVDLKRYDEFGREAVKNLPYSNSHTLNYRNQAIDDQMSFYSSPPPTVQPDGSPFAKTKFEPSPLNRVVEQGAPGASWQPGSGHTVTKKYEFNMLSEVYLFRYDAVTGLVSLPAIEADKYYQPNQLYANKTYDEQGNEVIEYIDKQGRTICKKVYVETISTVKQYASTYYVYDDFSSLVVVLPPEAINRFSQQCK